MKEVFLISICDNIGTKKYFDKDYLESNYRIFNNTNANNAQQYNTYEEAKYIVESLLTIFTTNEMLFKIEKFFTSK